MSAVLLVFNRDGDPIDPALLNRMMTATAFRAVDGQDRWIGGHVALAHQHFLVTPEEQGESQPLVFNDERHAISFDGRLDNRRSLIDSLGLWSPVDSPSDATIVLQAYLRWGDSCADYLIGDFAFVIWDGVREQVFLACDPIGGRHLYYFASDSVCVIATSIAAILMHPVVPIALNEGVIAERLANYYYNQEETPYEGVFSCPPGHAMVFTERGSRSWRHWLPNLGERRYHGDPREYSLEFLHLLQQSVRDRMRFVGKAGIGLSGGLDSTSLAALVCSELREENRLPAQGLSTFTYAFDRFPNCDEREYADRLAQQIPLARHDVSAEGHALAPTDEVPYLTHDNEAIGSTSLLGWSLMKQVSQQGCRVLITGDGGDELFERQINWDVDLFLDLRWRELWRSMGGSRNAGRSGRRLGRGLVKMSLPSRYLAARHRRQRQARIMGQGMPLSLQDRVDLIERTEPPQLFGNESRPGQLMQLSVIHWYYTTRAYATAADWASRLGIEFIRPFRDVRLLEFVLSIPAYIQGMPGAGYTKRVLREAMVGYLPESIRLRSTLR